MPVATRSNTRKMRSLTVYAKPSPPEAAAHGRSKPSSRMTSKPTSIGKRTKTVPKAIPRAAIKRSCKVANVEVAVAAPEAGEVERAERMRLEWDAIVRKRPPLKTLTGDDLPRPGKHVPHRLYGWPITEDYMLDYARRHRLVFEVSSHHRPRFGGKTEFNYGDLTDSDLMDEDLALSVRRCVIFNVIIHIIRKVGATGLKFERPVSRKWDWMLVLWSTRDYEQRYAAYQARGSWERVKTFIDNALNECLPDGCDRRTSLEWWWSRENRLS